jgi:hypothetical protein
MSRVPEPLDTRGVPFDAVAWRERVSARFAQETAGMSPVQVRAFIHQRIAGSRFAAWLDRPPGPAPGPGDVTAPLEPPGAQAFDVIAWKRDTSARFSRDTQGMTGEEVRRYLHDRIASGPFADRLPDEPHARVALTSPTGPTTAPSR